MARETSAGATKHEMGTMAKALIVLALLGAVVAAVYLKENARAENSGAAARSTGVNASPESAAVIAKLEPVSSVALPRLVDLGAKKCIPCKLMAPILDQLRSEFGATMAVEFIDVWEDPKAGEKHGVELIPTQIFYDAAGKELYRHQGFYSREDILAKWNELGVTLGGSATDAPTFARLEPAVPDTRPADTVCYMCDGDVNAKTRVVLGTDKGDVYLCSPHCYFITYTSLEQKDGVDERATGTDWSNGQSVPLAKAVFVVGNEPSGRPTVKTFATADTAEQERQASGGSVLDWAGLRSKELANRCGFCDRAVYPEDASEVYVEGLHTWGCCSMCALGVAARLQKDIEVIAKDALSGEPIRVVTLDGKVALLEPASAVAWAGMKMGPENKPVSTGCFKQAFFTSEEFLKQWVEQHPTATGKAIRISQALADKMKLSPEQISKACKIGECAPKK